MRNFCSSLTDFMAIGTTYSYLTSVVCSFYKNWGVIVRGQISFGIWTWPARRTSRRYACATRRLSLRKSFMFPPNLLLRNSSKVPFWPKRSSAYVKRPMFRIESMFSVFCAEGARTTMMKSCSAFGPNFNVILFVSSFDTGFSTYQD